MKTLRWIDKAVCLGNGKSRLGLDLKKMKEYAKNKDLTLVLPVSSGQPKSALYEKLGFKHMGNIWRIE